MPPALVHYATETEYRQHYERCYCQAKLHTFDGMRVFFAKQQFEDAFFESRDRRARDKSQFSRDRAERIDWIAAAIAAPAAELYAGWDRDRKRYDRERRITLVWGDYVVVLKMNLKKKTAFFITAYVAEAGTVSKIRSGPRWEGETAGEGK